MMLGLGASAASRDASGTRRRAMRRWQDMGAGGVDPLHRVAGAEKTFFVKFCNLWLHTGDIGKFDEDGFYYIEGRIKRFIKIFGNRVSLDEIENIAKENNFIDNVAKKLELNQNKYQEIGDNRLLLEKQVMLQVLDVHWKEHLAEIDHLRNSIGLRAYAQKNPKNEFKKEAYSMFESMLDEIDSGTVRILFSLQIANEEDVDSLKQNEQKQEITLEKAFI